jgi:RHS repeat-associated protein
MTTVYAYDTRNRMTKLEHKDGGTVIDGFTYSMDKDGAITTTTESDNDYWNYEYDGRGRLTKALFGHTGYGDLARYDYVYSPGDTMLTKAMIEYGAGGYSFYLSYNPANELTKRVSGAREDTLAYDAWGRLTTKTVTGFGAANYYYNYGDKLTKLSSNIPGEGTVDYEYGADQKRRERVSGGTTTWYNYDVGWDVLNEENSAGTLSLTYVHDPMKPIGTVLADLAGTTPATGTARYYHQDNIGSTRRLVNASKTTISAIMYDPFGAGMGGSGTTHLYTGHDWDETSELYYAPYRYYSPEFARWLTRDPLGMVDGPNVYAYVANNPINSYDLLGLWKNLLCKTGCAAGAFAFTMEGVQICAAGFVACTGSGPLAIGCYIYVSLVCIGGMCLVGKALDECNKYCDDTYIS